MHEESGENIIIDCGKSNVGSSLDLDMVDDTPLVQHMIGFLFDHKQ